MAVKSAVKKSSIYSLALAAVGSYVCIVKYELISDSNPKSNVLKKNPV